MNDLQSNNKHFILISDVLQKNIKLTFQMNPLKAWSGALELLKRIVFYIILNNLLQLFHRDRRNVALDIHTKTLLIH